MSAGRALAVTGASGFLGRFAVPWLVARGHQVRAVARDQAAPPMTCADCRIVPTGASLKEWSAAFRGCDAVLHLAARAHVMEDTAVDPLQAYRAANVDLTRLVLEAAADAGCDALVLASSVKAVGDRTTAPLTEHSTPAPADPYGQSKLEAESVVADRGRQLGVRTASLRFPLMYGPGMRANMLHLFQAVARGAFLPLGGFDNRRSLLYVGNAAAALETAAQHAAARGAYFVSDGVDLSTADLVRAIAVALNRGPRLVSVPAPIFRAAGRVGDFLSPWLPALVTSQRVQRLVDSLQVDSGRFRRECEFVPPYTIEAGMLETARWLVGQSGRASRHGRSP